MCLGKHKWQDGCLGRPSHQAWIGEVEGQEDGTMAVVMDYVGCAHTVEDTPVDGSLWNVWVHGTAGQRKVPRSTGASVRSSTCVWAYGTRYGWLYGGTRICLGRRIVRCKQGIGRSEICKLWKQQLELEAGRFQYYSRQSCEGALCLSYCVWIEV